MKSICLPCKAIQCFTDNLVGDHLILFILNVIYLRKTKALCSFRINYLWSKFWSL